MRKALLYGIAVVLFASCQQRYTQQSKEIDTYKRVIEAYEKQDWKDLVLHYADTATILNNATKKNAQTVGQLIAQNKEESAFFTDWKYVSSESEYEMVVTDKGETWVNFFGLWRGTLKTNGKAYEIPTFITARFVDGKIVRELGYWDVSKLVADIQNIESAAKVSDVEMSKE